MRRSFERFLVARLTLGDARPPQCAETRHGRLCCRDRLRYSLENSGFVLPGRTIVPAICHQPARPGPVQRCLLYTPCFRLAEVQGLALRRQDPPDRQIRVRAGRPAGQTDPCPLILRPIPGERETVAQQHIRCRLRPENRHSVHFAAKGRLRASRNNVTLVGLLLGGGMLRLWQQHEDPDKEEPPNHLIY